MVDALDLGSSAARCASSSLASRTIFFHQSRIQQVGYRQAVRHWFLIPAFPGSNPGTPAIFFRMERCKAVKSAIGVSPSGKAPVFDTGIPWFESRYPSHLFRMGRSKKVNCVIGVSPSGKALVFDTSIPWFESRYPSHTTPLTNNINGYVAQLVRAHHS